MKKQHLYTPGTLECSMYSLGFLDERLRVSGTRAVQEMLDQ